MNSFPSKNGVSDTLAPRVIIIEMKMDFNLNFKMTFGDYSQVYERTGNDMTDCTVGAICLEPNYNLQGGYKFYILKTGNKLERHKFTACMVTQDVIDWVHQ